MRALGLGALVLSSSLACGTGDSGNAPSDGGDAGNAGDANAGDSQSSDSASADAAREAGPPPCGSSAWTTYGHDPQRTGATDACISGALTLAYRYVPAAPATRKLVGVYTAIADSAGATVGWAASDPPYLGTSAVDRVDAKGARVWTWDSGTDSNLGDWLSSALGNIVVNEDGLTFLDPATGKVLHSNGVDNWGSSAFDAQRIYALNSSHVDGPGIYVGAYDPAQKQLWTKNTYGKCRIDVADRTAGIAFDGDTLYYAPDYSPGTAVVLTFQSGVYAFAGADGTQKWFQPTTPASMISTGGGLVYLVETTAQGADSLVARKQSDGTVAWTKPLMNAGSQAPVLAAGQVIVATSTTVQSFDAAAGTPGWTAQVTAAGQPVNTLAFSGGCAGAAVNQSYLPFTTLAAALSSSTLVVVAGGILHELALADGTDRWQGAVPMAMGLVRNPVLVGKRVYLEDGMAMLALDAP
jgi:hypothetical protein